ncbi:MAG: hypothetical protein ACRC28_18550 [Clostridium sp.]|uniref:hypothetical protein n=1 Tax=Clostridium sp. TaxID=1506 RepID=UPI003F3BDE30
MKKRAMKKYIPKNTDYCYDCKNRVNWKIIPKYLDFCEKEIPIQVEAFRCRYCRVDSETDACFWDGIKSCGISEKTY